MDLGLALFLHQLLNEGTQCINVFPVYPWTYYIPGAILITDDLTRDKEKSLSQVLFQ